MLNIIELHLDWLPKELRIIAEPLPETQGSVAGNRMLASDYLGNVAWRHVNLARKLHWSEAEFLQLILEDDPGMHSSHEHATVSTKRVNPEQYLMETQGWGHKNSPVHRLVVPAFNPLIFLKKMARPGRFELPTS
nr:hypothetical protein [Fodinicurvata sediminis]